MPKHPDSEPADTSTGTVTTDRMVVLFLVMLVTAAGNTAMQSVMPSIGTKLGVADMWVSLAYSWSALLWMTMAPRWARQSDKRGRKALMKLGMIGFISSFSLCGAILWVGLNGWVSGTVTLLLFAAARSLYGLYGSAAPPAVQAYVAARTSRDQRTGALSLIASSFGLGTVLGPALAPLVILPMLGLVSPFLVFAIFAMLVLIALKLRLPDDTPRYAARGQIVSEPTSSSAGQTILDDHHDDDELAETGPPERLRWQDKRLRPWLIVGLVGGHAQAVILGIIGFLILDRLGYRANPDDGTGPIGLVLMSGAFATLLAQWGLIPMMHMGPRSATLWGSALAAIGCLILAMGQDLHAITLGFVILSLGFGLFRPGFTAGSSLAVTRAEQGQVAGIVASVNGAAYMVAPAIGVWLYGHHPAIGFGVVIGFCAFILIWGWRALQTEISAT